MELLQLPTEIITCILHNLGGEDLIRCRCVCTNLADTINENTSLLYSIELYLANMSDDENHGVGNDDTCSRREMLRRHQRPWSNPGGEQVKILIDASVYFTDPAYTLIDGIFAVHEDGRLLLVQVPSPTRQVEHKNWAINVGFRIQELYLSVEQDLLVLVRRRQVGDHLVHLLHLSTGQPHCDAAINPLQVDRVRASGAGNYALEAYGDLLSVRGTPLDEGALIPGYLKVWNWKTGNLLWSTKAVILRSCFITTTFVLILGVRGRKNCTLQLVNLKNEPQPRIHCTLEYPLSLPHKLLGHFNIDMLTSHGSGPPGLFHISTTNKIIVIKIELVYEHEEDFDILHVIPFTALSLFLSRDYRGKSLAWAEWGAKRTHIMGGFPYFRVHGMRLFVRQDVQGTTPAPGNEVHIFDFHQPFLRFRDDPSSPWDTIRTGDSERIRRSMNARAYDTATRLPFKLCRKVLPGHRRNLNPVIFGGDVIIWRNPENRAIFMMTAC